MIIQELNNNLEKNVIEINSFNTMLERKVEERKQIIEMELRSKMMEERVMPTSIKAKESRVIQELEE